jgi:hypothetical protein
VSDDTGESPDGSDWLARQFGAADDAAKPDEAKVPVEPEQPDAPVAAQPPAIDPFVPAADAPAAALPTAFDWGFGTKAAEPAEPEPEPEPVPTPAPAPAPAPAPEPAPPVPALIEPPQPPPADPTQAMPLLPLVEPPAPDAALAGPPHPGAEPPTVAFPWEAAPDPIAPDAPTELLGAQTTEPLDPALDSLFGSAAFKEYEDPGIVASSPFAAAAAGSGGRGRAQREPREKGAPLPRNQRILIIAAIAVVAVLILVGLFFAGTRLPGLIGPAPAVAISKTPTPTPTPTPTIVPVGPVAAGDHKWNELRGAECLNPFTSVWAEKFTVVDCATPHAAQMVFRGTFPATAAAPSTATPAPTAAPGGYPGIAALQAQISLLCTSPAAIDFTAAGAYTDIQFQASYAADAKEWAAGQHDYFCFVTRSSGQPLTGSVAGPIPG